MVETLIAQVDGRTLSSPDLQSHLEGYLPVSECYMSSDHLSARLWAIDGNDTLVSIAVCRIYDDCDSGVLKSVDVWVADDMLTLDVLHLVWGPHALFLAGARPFGAKFSNTDFCPPPDLYAWHFTDAQNVLAVAARPVGQTGVPLLQLLAIESAHRCVSGDLMDQSRHIAFVMPSLAYLPPNPPWYPKPSREEEIAAERRWVTQQAATFLEATFAEHNADHLHLIPFRGRYHALWRRNRQVVVGVCEVPYHFGNQLAQRKLDYQRGFLEDALKLTNLEPRFQSLQGQGGTRFVIRKIPPTVYEFARQTELSGGATDWVALVKAEGPLILEVPVSSCVAEFCALAWKEGVNVLALSDNPVCGIEDAHRIVRDRTILDDLAIERAAIFGDYDVLLRIVGAEATGSPCLDRDDLRLGEFYCMECNRFFVAIDGPVREINCPLCLSTDYPAIRKVDTMGDWHFLMSDTGSPDIKLRQSNLGWSFDNGREIVTYDKSPLLKDAIRVSAGLDDILERAKCR